MNRLKLNCTEEKPYSKPHDPFSRYTLTSYKLGCRMLATVATSARRPPTRLSPLKQGWRAASAAYWAVRGSLSINVSRQEKQRRLKPQGAVNASRAQSSRQLRS